jgi:hypothetical protein
MFLKSRSWGALRQHYIIPQSIIHCLDTVQVITKSSLHTVQVITKSSLHTVQVIIESSLQTVQAIAQGCIVQLII